MADFGPEIVDQVEAACNEGIAEAQQAFERAFDVQVQMTVGQSGTWIADTPRSSTGFQGAGLALVFKIGQQAAVALLPEEGGLLPDWYAAPDATGQSKLATLAQELGMIFFPEEFMPDDFQAGRVEHLSEASAGGGVADDAVLLTLELTAAENRSCQLGLLWPLTQPGELLAPATDPEEKDAEPAEFNSPDVPSPDVPSDEKVVESSTLDPSTSLRPAEIDMDRLPTYARSLLKVRVPVVVKLASKQQLISKILQIGIGSIIQFEKGCEEVLDLEAGGQPMARGEAVKVGEKFGLRITSIVLPDERFKTVPPKK